MSTTEKNNENWHVVYKTNNMIIRFVGGRFQRKINTLLKKIGSETKNGLELGCGEAHLLNYLLQKKTIGSVIALDLSRDDLDFAQSMYPNFNYIQGDAESTPFVKDTFDYVMALEVLEHVQNPSLVLEEILRIAKPEARFLVSVPNEPFFHLGNLFRAKYIKRLGKTPNHISFWSVSQFSRFLNEYFIIDEKYSVSVFPWQLYLCRPRKM